jgi:hypothetical protein
MNRKRLLRLYEDLDQQYPQYSSKHWGQAVPIRKKSEGLNFEERPFEQFGDRHKTISKSSVPSIPKHKNRVKSCRLKKRESRSPSPQDATIPVTKTVKEILKKISPQ